MQNNFERFLEFNGKRITVLSADGTWWVAVRPICEALNVNYDRQYKNILDDDILAGVYAKQHTHDKINRVQEMVCLPEKYVYGWLFSIRSESPELKEYKKECYDVLYDHFHGTITQRMEVLNKRTENSLEIARLEEKLQLSEERMKIEALKKEQRELEKRLRQIDQDLINGQTVIDFPS